MPNLDSPISQLNKIGKVLEKRLNRLGIVTIRDLLFYLPFRYEDYSDVCEIKDVPEEGNITVHGKVELITNRRSRKSRMMITEALISDPTGQMKIMWFNQPFIKRNIPIGSELSFSGKITNKYSNQVLTNPSYEPLSSSTQGANTGGVLPVYPTTEKLTQKQLRFLIKQALQYLDLLEDWVPEEIRIKRQLMSLKEAIMEIHFPSDDSVKEKAQKRMQYDHLFWMQGKVCFLKNSLQSFLSPQLVFYENETKKFVDDLSFDLTDAQKKVSWKILQDIQKGNPMNRLVQGDVGSGKTIVAFISSLNALLSGYQVVMMAPTEILAKQHYENAKNFFKDSNFSIQLLTSSTKKGWNINNDLFGNADQDLSQEESLNYMKKGEAQLIIGTHSLIQDTVDFYNLGFIIVDEQHRFGVKQRGVLRKKLNKTGLSPHYLSMTATPIPRTQALFLYGDLDISVIDEMPKGRKRVETKLIEESDRRQSYEFVSQQIDKGRQVFVICPLIDPSDALEVKSVEEVSENLKTKIFSKYNVEILHGRLKPVEKDQIMKDFKDKKFDILVSTSVVEVGVDVPNATIMMIEGAERFGLAQLHQFRGRVGRGDHQSYCLLFPSELSEASARLKTMETVYNGFELAQKDLELRGSGEVYGTRQSGTLDLNLLGNDFLSDPKNYRVIEEVREDIFEILDQNKVNGKHEEIIQKIQEYSEDIYLE